MEGKIIDAFPGPENRNLRVALYEIAWAFARVEGEEPEIGPALARVLRDRTPEAIRDLGELVRKSILAFKLSADEVLDASLRLELHLIDKESEQRGA